MLRVNSYYLLAVIQTWKLQDKHGSFRTNMVASGQTWKLHYKHVNFRTNMETSGKTWKLHYKHVNFRTNMETSGLAWKSNRHPQICQQQCHMSMCQQRHPEIDIHLRYCQPFTLVLTFPVFASNTLPTK